MSKSASALLVDPVVPQYKDPFNPVLSTPNPLDVNEEQRDNIRAILETSCSDSRFVQKAYLAILLTLTGSTVVPVIESITPSEGVAGTLAVPVIVSGNDFDSGAVVQQAGVPVNTNFTSENELEATLDLSGAAEGSLAISVRNSSGMTSDAVNFTVTAPALQSVPSVPSEEDTVITPPSFEESFTRTSSRSKKDK